MVGVVKKVKPIYRNAGLSDAVRYRLPRAGKVLILHRVSGALMLPPLPFAPCLLERSLTSKTSLAKFTALLFDSFAKIIAPTLIWVYLRHLYAGTRYLVPDLHVSINKTSALKPATSVLIASLLLTAVLDAKLFGLS